MQIIRKNPKLGNYLHYLHQTDARHAGYEQVPNGYHQVQIGVDEETGEPIIGDGDPIYIDGDDLFAADWDEAWGEPPTDEELAAWEEPEPEPPPPVTDVDIARNYANAYQAAQDIIFLLMGRVAPALVIGKHFTEETVNKEGSRFTRYHQAEIEAFKLAGRHPDAGDALYDAVAASADEFPWLLANNELILGIFATTLPRNPK